MSRPITGRVEVEWRDREVEVVYEINDDGDPDWVFVDPALNQEKLTLDEEERIAERCWEDQWI